MSQKHDIFLRAHTVVVPRGQKEEDTEKANKRREFKPKSEPRWPKEVVVFDCESRINPGQQFTFGFFRTLELVDDEYQLVEEGAFFDDELSHYERKILESYVRTADTEVKTFPPRFPLYKRSQFVKAVLYKLARRGAMIVGFHISFDLSRLARKWSEGKKNEWSLVLVEYKDGNENLNYPRITIEPLDSKKAFVGFTREWIPKDGRRKPTKINESRFLDLRTLLWALFNQPLSLKTACQLEAFKKYNLPKKIDHKPTGKVTLKEIRYARQDVKCTAALLNAAKKEFDLHSIPVPPDRAYSPASIAKGYLTAMNILRPQDKFDVAPKHLGIAMEGYLGGRSETRIRLRELPVVPVDFTSEYPSTCALLRLWDVITAESLSFDDATAEVHDLLNRITHDDCFNRQVWPDFRFFALVKPNEDIFPVRTVYNGTTTNIGNNYLTDKTPIWFAGPDLIASAIQTGRPPKIEKAIRLVPHGKQQGMKPVNLRGMVEIDPYTDDLFKRVIEQRKLNKSNKELYYWLKVLANAIYGFFVEINPEPTPERKPVKVHVYSGEASYSPETSFWVKEKQGVWYAPYLASLITSSGRLLLGLLEKSVSNAGGTYAWADTDALAIVSSQKGGSLRHVPGCDKVKALPWIKVKAIVSEFERLNPYEFPGSILNVTDANHVNSDVSQPRRQLLGLSISAKRYALYERKGQEITIVDPKAHGLGYLYPPIDSPTKWEEEHDAPKWIYEFWESLLRIPLRLKRDDPFWLKRFQMMRMAVTTNNVLKRLRSWKGFRPYNFFLLPILADGGYPAGVNPKHLELAASFESEQEKWTQLECINIADSGDPRKYRLIASFTAAEYGKRAVVDTFENLLYRYIQHPEAKSLAPDGGPCRAETRGLLQRAHILGGKHRRIGKDADRRWEEGENLESLIYRPIEYQESGKTEGVDNRARASESLIRKIKKIGIRKLVRAGYGRRILDKICRREPIAQLTLLEYERIIKKWKL